MELTLIRTQHYQMKKIIAEIEDLMKDEEPEENLLLIALKIGTLSGILTMHLHFEDDYLYPELLKHKEGEVKKTVSSFKDQMGDLSIQYDQFSDTFLKRPDTIMDVNNFFSETKKMLSAVLTRIEHEEYGLFPMLG
ncbi:MAG: hemerythrin domain-containing protein [Dehalobacter sp. 4CP]|uniref:hemerythrin domain-containing protein n=1 Tax=Dehalobacter sp. CP TaxID=2594474 RepID=UPI0013C66296|nr:hemerythrin domain-containing protein [Dehalobacter sp. 4CP]